MNKQLSTEQEFELVKFKSNLRTLDEEQLRDLCVHLFHINLNMMNTFKSLLKHHWFNSHQ